MLGKYMQTSAMLVGLLLTVLLFAMPTSAHAWNLVLQVADGNASHYVTVGSNVTQYKSGSKSYSGLSSPLAANTIRIFGDGAVSTLDGAPVNLLTDTIPAPVLPATTRTVRVVFTTFVSCNVTVGAQPIGATVYVQQTAPIVTANRSSLTGVPSTATVVISAFPRADYLVTGIVVNGLSRPMTPAAPAVEQIVSYTLSSAELVTNPSVSATAVFRPKLAALIYTNSTDYDSGSTVTLNASGTSTTDSGIASYAFSLYSSPSYPALNANGSTATFAAPATTGLYKARVVATSINGATGTATTAFNVITAFTSNNNYCFTCHSNRTTVILTKYKSSLHYTSGMVSCVGCHVGARTVWHPGPRPTSATCQGCHFDAQGNFPNHPIDIGANSCLTCHDPHSAAGGNYSNSAPHFNNITTGVYPASYMTSRNVCGTCHVSSLANPPIRQGWKDSGHADTTAPAWMSNDFKTQSGCVQCHTTTGFIAYSTGKVTAAWGVATDKTKEVLTCGGCHLSISTGALRTVTPIRPYADDTGYTNPNLGKSNLCMNCHSGTKNGKSITAQFDAAADFTDLPFIGSHYMAAGGTSYGRAGYHFAGRTYNAAAVHSTKLGTDGSGSCLACHKNNENGHKFQAGATAICTGCHGATFNAARLSSDRAAFLNALEVLRAQLEVNLAAKGYTYSSSYPHFSNNSNWGAGQAGADTMGAAFNYVLFLTEPGAYAHNPLYASQLVIDSIDYLDNGQFDDSVSSLAVPGLLDGSAITQAVADSMTVYRSKNPCLTCHGGTTATISPMATNAHDAHLSANYGPGAYLGSAFSSCQSCHSFGEATHMNGSANLGAGACDSCHPGAAPTWSGARVSCTACHAAVASTLTNGVAAPYKADFALKGHGQFPASNQCAACHDANSRHITGFEHDDVRLSLNNDNNLCASCHRNPAVVGASFLNMTTHVSLSCRTCHDPHGTANPSMIRTVIAGNPISFTETTAGLIDTNTNMGLCQGCHVGGNTSFYQAGVPETNHFTTGCLNCHKHNSGFLPSGCDSCHGYPPAPVITSNVVGFGTASNWANARFEDYSGGGGAHLVPAHVSPFAVASEGWTNCTICHNGGSTGTTPYHVMATPVASHISNITVDVDKSYRFDSGFTIYTGAKNLNPPALNVTGSCFNINCHLSASPRWSMER